MLSDQRIANSTIQNRPAASKPSRTVRIPMAVTVFGTYFLLIELYRIIFPKAGGTPLDEIFALLLAYPALIALISFRRLKIALILFLLYVAITICGNVLYHYGGVTQPMAALVDMALDFKPLLIEGGFVYLFSRSNDPQREMERICWIIIIVALFNSFFVIYDLHSGSVGSMGLPLDLRNGFYQPMGFQMQKVRSAALTMLASSFMLYFAINRRSIMAALGGIYLGALVFLHQSAKEMVAFIAVLPFVLPGRGVKGLRPVLSICSIAVLALLVVITPVGSFLSDRVDYFTGTSGADKARTLLVERGYEIARDHVPLGTGAGTFGSGPSFQMGYSGVYYRYGLANVWGASPDRPNFLQDAYWGKILGQSGFLGTAIYLAFLAAAFGACFRLDRLIYDSSAVPACAAVILSIFVSTASSPFSDEFTGAILAVFSAYALAMLRALALAASATQPELVD